MLDLDTDSNTTSESDKTCSQLRDRDITFTSEQEENNDRESALKRKIEKLELENEMLRVSNMKKMKRKPKSTNKGIHFKPLRVIKKEDRLSDDRMYPVRKVIRNQIFMQMKYFMEEYKDDSVTLALTALGTMTEENKVKYSDYIVYFVDKKITSQRNNAIHGLKRVLVGLEDEGKYQQSRVLKTTR